MAPVPIHFRTQQSVQSSRPIRIYVLELWSFVPYYVAALCTALREAGLDVTLGSARYHLDRQYFRKSAVSIDHWLIDLCGAIRNPHIRRVGKALEYVVNLCVLAVRFFFRPPDILHVQYLPFLDRGLQFELLFMRLAQRLGIRVVYTVHNITFQDREADHLAVYSNAYRLADLLICHGDLASARLQQEFGIPREKIQVIPHGPLYSHPPNCSQAEARASLGISMEKPLVLCAGVISEYKGIPFLLASWRRMLLGGGEGRLLIAGTGSEGLLESIRVTAESAQLVSSVDLRLRFIPVEELPRYYHAADILVYPYSAGTTSGALLTGLQYNRAIIATDLPVFREHLRNGENSLLVSFGDEEQFAQSLRLLMENSALRCRLADAAMVDAGRGSSWASIALQTRSCYESLLCGLTSTASKQKLH